MKLNSFSTTMALLLSSITKKSDPWDYFKVFSLDSPIFAPIKILFSELYSALITIGITCIIIGVIIQLIIFAIRASSPQGREDFKKSISAQCLIMFFLGSVLSVFGIAIKIAQAIYLM